MRALYSGLQPAIELSLALCMYMNIHVFWQGFFCCISFLIVVNAERQSGSNMWPCDRLNWDFIVIVALTSVQRLEPRFLVKSGFL